MQAKISSSEQQIKDLMDKAEALERQNEHLNARNRELEVAAHVAAQNAAAAGVRACLCHALLAIVHFMHSISYARSLSTTGKDYALALYVTCLGSSKRGTSDVQADERRDEENAEASECSIPTS